MEVCRCRSESATGEKLGESIPCRFCLLDLGGVVELSRHAVSGVR
jgi:hypothetical protein